MGKAEVFELLRSTGFAYGVTEHKAVYTMSDLRDVDLPYPEAIAKNLFVRDDKKQNWYLISVKGDKRVDLKAFRKANGTRQLTMASAEDLFDKLKLLPGSVTPMGLLNDEDRKVTLFLDRDYCGGIIGCHPNDNTATVWLQADDLIRLLRDLGHPVSVVEL